MALEREGEDLTFNSATIYTNTDNRYIGSILTNDGRDNKDILTKIGKELILIGKHFYKVKISINKQRYACPTLIESCVTYG